MIKKSPPMLNDMNSVIILKSNIMVCVGIRYDYLK